MILHKNHLPLPRCSSSLIILLGHSGKSSLPPSFDPLDTWGGGWLLCKTIGTAILLLFLGSSFLVLHSRDFLQTAALPPEKVGFHDFSGFFYSKTNRHLGSSKTFLASAPGKQRRRWSTQHLSPIPKGPSTS